MYLQMSAFRRYAHDRRALLQQLRSFSVRHARCSDPEDRKTIEQTILTWFDTDDLEVCNQKIREMIGGKVLALGPAQHYPTAMLWPILLLHLFNNAAAWNSGLSCVCIKDYAAGTWYEEDTLWKVLGPLLGFGIWLMLMVPLSFRLSHCFPMKCSMRPAVKVARVFHLSLAKVRRHAAEWPSGPGRRSPVLFLL